MNDSKNSSNGLLVINTPLQMKSDQLGKLRETIQTLADDLDLTPVALCDGLTVSAVVDYTPLLTRLCVAVERLVAQGEPPTVSEEIAPQALNARLREPGEPGECYQPVAGSLNARPPAGR